MPASKKSEDCQTECLVYPSQAGAIQASWDGVERGVGGGVNWVFEYEYNYGVIFFYESSGVYRSVKEYNYCEILFLYESCLCVHTSVREYIV